MTYRTRNGLKTFVVKTLYWLKNSNHEAQSNFRRSSHAIETFLRDRIITDRWSLAAEKYGKCPHEFFSLKPKLKMKLHQKHVPNLWLKLQNTY